MKREEPLPFMRGVLVGPIIVLAAVLVSEIVTNHPRESPPVTTKPDECKGISAGQVWEYAGGPDSPFDGRTLSFRSKVLDVKGRYVKYEVLPGGDLPPRIESAKCSWYLIDSERLP